MSKVCANPNSRSARVQMGLQSKPQKEPWVCTQVRLGRKGFFWGGDYSQISSFCSSPRPSPLCLPSHSIQKESTPWRPQVRLRLIRLGLSMRWPLPLKLWREWNGYYNEEAIGLPLLTSSIRSGETNFIFQSFPLSSSGNHIRKEVFSLILD